MPFWINGWLEVRRGVAQDALAWSGVLRIGPLVDVADGVSERLFGLSKRLASAPSNGDAIAAQRGAPADPSEEVRAEFDEHAAHEREFGPGELGGHTHATWIELSDQLRGKPLSTTRSMVNTFVNRPSVGPRARSFPSGSWTSAIKLWATGLEASCSLATPYFVA